MLNLPVGLVVQSLERTGPNLLADTLEAVGVTADPEKMFKEEYQVDGLGESLKWRPSQCRASPVCLASLQKLLLNSYQPMLGSSWWRCYLGMEDRLEQTADSHCGGVPAAVCSVPGLCGWRVVPSVPVV